MAAIKRVRKTQPRNNKKLFNAIKKATMPVMEEHTELRERVTATWSEDDKPTFVPSITLEGNIITWALKVDAPEAPSSTTGISVWRLLNDGTKVMRAIMTQPFERKTQPGQFASGPGQGGLYYYSKNISLPGIRRGGWDEKANQLLEPKMKRAINMGVKNVR